LPDCRRGSPNWRSRGHLRYLALANTENLCAADGTNSLCCWLTILHGYRLSVLHFSLGSALHAICLHRESPFMMLVGN
jgi:hypothetical protein